MRPHASIIVGYCTPHHFKILENRGERFEGISDIFPHALPIPWRPSVTASTVTSPPLSPNHLPLRLHLLIRCMEPT